MPRIPDSTKCPECGYSGLIDYFDAGGACQGNVFCPRCGCEFDPVTSEVHTADPEVCEGCKRVLAETEGFRVPNPSSLYIGGDVGEDDLK